MPDSPAELLRHAASLEERQVPHVVVTVLATRGSAPQDESAKMIVAAAGREAGTVGGGKLEAAAIREAADLLAAGRSCNRIVEWDLKNDIGMTCGGVVTLLFEVRSPKVWTVAVFGAGHVSQALIPMLVPLPVLLEVRDSRPEWIGRLPVAPNLRATVSDDPAGAVAALPAGAFVLCITQGHQTDRPILEAALRRGDLGFVGAIGSRSKAAVLKRELREAGLGDDALAVLHCPLGLELGTNHPQEIAISISAQLLLERDRVLSH